MVRRLTARPAHGLRAPSSYRSVSAPVLRASDRLASIAIPERLLRARLLGPSLRRFRRTARLRSPTPRRILQATVAATGPRADPVRRSADRISAQTLAQYVSFHFDSDRLVTVAAPRRLIDSSQFGIDARTIHSESPTHTYDSSAPELAQSNGCPAKYQPPLPRGRFQCSGFSSP